MDKITQNLYAKKLIFTLVRDFKSIQHIHQSYLYNYGITGDDMIQLSRKDKKKLATNDDIEREIIYQISEEHIPIPPESIEIVEKSPTSNDWSYDFGKINEVDEWECISNIEWEKRDENGSLVELGYHLNELYRKENDQYIHEANSKCKFTRNKFIIAKLVDGLFDKQISSMLLFENMDDD